MAFRRRKSKFPKEIGGLLEQQFNKMGFKEQYYAYQLHKGWEELVGPRLAKRSSPGTLQKGRLVVVVTDPIWMTQMRFMSKQLIYKFNKALNKSVVKEIYFKVGQLPTVPEVEDEFQVPDRQLTPAEQEQIEESTAHVADPEVKKVVSRILKKQIILGSN